MDNGLKAKLLYEISQIDKLIVNAKPLFDLCKIKKPGFIEISAASMVLHSFYNGLENILILIIKHYEGKLPDSNKWHMELLDKAFIADENRKQIFSNDLQIKIEEYLKFRHFVRHAYGFQLEWERMENLINGIDVFWSNIKENLNNFMS
ncbi:MAG: hypothetical protein FWD87_03710 [Spirochaetaceae bacterium]|nr:hypothetical protein [Spirochaetaceae bacterium]